MFWFGSLGGPPFGMGGGGNGGQKGKGEGWVVAPWTNPSLAPLWELPMQVQMTPQYQHLLHAQQQQLQWSGYG
eukprot:14407769-Alexandrium_andersonii.AAC.1